MKVMTIEGPVDLDLLEVKDVVELCENTRKIATEFRLDGELVRRDVAVSMLMPPTSAEITAGELR